MRVRAQKTFSAYIGSQIITLAKGEEVEGDLALAFVQASCAVDIVDDPHGVLEEAAEFHPEPVAPPAPVLDPQQIGEPAPADEPAPVDEPAVTKVRVRSGFRAYDGANVVDFTEGQEIDGDLAALLAASDCDVEVLKTEDAVAEPEQTEQPEQTDPAAKTPAGEGKPVQGPADPAGDSADDPAAADDPGAHNVPEVLAFVKANPEQAAAVLAAEKAGKQRTTLLTKLVDLADPQG